MKTSLLCSLLLVLLTFPAAMAQNESEKPGPPKVLLINREEIKPGLMPAHNRHSQTYASVFARLKTDNYRIAMAPIAGNENEVLYVTSADSFAEMERIQMATDRAISTVPVSMRSEMDKLDKEGPELHSAMRQMLAVYRPELSFNPGAPIPQMRYFSVTTIRVRPGHDAQWVNYVQKILNSARKKAKLPETFHVAVFQVISGAPGGTYLAFRPMKSLSEMDTPIGRMAREAMSDDEKKDADKANAEAVMTSENSIYAFNPRMSYLPKEFTQMDAAFWAPSGAPTRAAVKPKKRVAQAAPPPAPPARQ
jgi:hypothetical protein